MHIISECPKCKIPFASDHKKCHYCGRETVVTTNNYKPNHIPTTLKTICSDLEYYLQLNVSNEDKLKIIMELLEAIKRYDRK